MKNKLFKIAIFAFALVSLSTVSSYANPDGKHGIVYLNAEPEELGSLMAVEAGSGIYVPPSIQYKVIMYLKDEIAALKKLEWQTELEIIVAGGNVDLVNDLSKCLDSARYTLNERRSQLKKVRARHLRGG